MNLFTHPVRVVLLSLLTLAMPLPAAESFLHFPAKDGSGQGKKIVLLAGDDEYRSEEGLHKKSTGMKHYTDSCLVPLAHT